MHGALWLASACLLLAVATAAAVAERTHTQSDAKLSSFIVSFTEHRPVAAWEALLPEMVATRCSICPASFELENTSCIEIKRRRNAATELPTDFLLISVADASDCLESLQHPLIQSISIERSYRHLLAVPSYADSLSENAAFSSGAAMRNEPETIDVEIESDLQHEESAWLVGSFEPPRRFSTGRVNLLDDEYHEQLSTHAQTLGEGETESLSTASHSSSSRSLLQAAAATADNGAISSASISRIYRADKLWGQGFTGAGIRVAVFDTGISASHSHFRRIALRTNWTDDSTLNDELGHGTHVAGVIAGTHPQCHGFAPDAILYTYRVFNSRQLSFTSWFLDAFNHALHTGIDVLNLSIGGPDFMDVPFVEKVRELSANGITVVSAIGNDGPLYGTLNNPADQMDVLGVGGIHNDHTISPFSSRGMTTHELPFGYGRVKPDLVAFANQIMGSRIQGGCRSQTGTSVASPVVAGAVALVASIIPVSRRAKELNPARLKQAMIAGAQPLQGPGIFEQGKGHLDVVKSGEFLLNTRPHVSVFPARLNLSDCPFMWPYCAQPLFHTQAPTLVNLTVLNSIAATSWIDSISFVPDADLSCSSDALSVTFAHSSPIWPWSGYLALSLQIKHDVVTSCQTGGEIELQVRTGTSTQHLTIALWASVIPAPARSRRLVWDQFRNLRYPSGYFPRDNLDVKTDTLDWNGDHPHTNFRKMFDALIAHGFFLDVLGHDYSCLNASLYSTLMIVDPEEEFFVQEVALLQRHVREGGLSLLVFADWYDVAVMREIRFFDENTAAWWTPITGGANVPALNELLAPFDLMLSDFALKGRMTLGTHSFPFNSGSSIARAPAGSRLAFASLQQANAGSKSRDFPVLALLEAGAGRLAVYGDSNCLDENNQHGDMCIKFLIDLLEYTARGVLSASLQGGTKLQPSAFSDNSITSMPSRMVGDRIAAFSRVTSPHSALQCDSEQRLFTPIFTSTARKAAPALRAKIKAL